MSIFLIIGPGTGKTALVTEIMSNLKLQNVMIVNCMNFTEPRKLYLHLLSEFKVDYKQDDDARQVLRDYLQDLKMMQ